jgi:hypothetical protein
MPVLSETESKARLMVILFIERYFIFSKDLSLRASKTSAANYFITFWDCFALLAMTVKLQ